MEIVQDAGHAHNMNVEDILSSCTRWDHRIATDLIAEIEIHFADNVTTITEMRRILAVKGCHGLRQRIEKDVEGKNDVDALRAMAAAMRNFALERPGLAAATFRSEASDCAEWRQAGGELAQTALQVFAKTGIKGESAEQALRILRGLVRGLVMHETSASFFADPSEYQRTFDLGIELFINGLPALAATTLPQDANARL